MAASLVEVFNYLLPSGRSGRQSVRAMSVENPNVDLYDETAWSIFGHTATDSGITIGPEDALRFGPVRQCVEIKSGDIGASTLHVHKNEVAPGESDVDYNQSAEKVCSLEWNETTPANEGWSNLVFHQQLFGDGYAYISRQGGAPNGRIQWMANLVPTSVTPMIAKDRGNALIYKLDIEGREPEFLNPWEVFHLRSLAIQPNVSLKMINLIRNELGLALGGKLFLSKFFSRGGHHGGILTLPPNMSAKAQDNLEKGVAKRANPSEWFKTLILRDGAQWQSATVDPRAAQMHELNEDEAREVCHFFNMPPWKLGLRNSESYNSAEQAQRSYITGTLMHLSTRICGEAQMKLLSDRTRAARTHRFEHNFTKLLQADIKTLNEVLLIQRSAEVINANEWRKKINLPERSDEKANEYYNPATTGTQVSEESPDDDRDTDVDTEDNEAAQNMRQLLSESVIRASKRLATIARNKSRKPNELLAWVDSNAAEHQQIVDEELRTPLMCAGKSPEVLLLASKTWLVTTLTSGVNQFLNPPYIPKDLEQHVQEFSVCWTETASGNWFREIYDAST